MGFFFFSFALSLHMAKIFIFLFICCFIVIETMVMIATLILMSVDLLSNHDYLTVEFGFRLRAGFVLGSLWLMNNSGGCVLPFQYSHFMKEKYSSSLFCLSLPKHTILKALTHTITVNIINQRLKCCCNSVCVRVCVCVCAWECI